jgi:hypothetical protein
MRTLILLTIVLLLSGCIDVSIQISSNQEGLEANYWDCDAGNSQQLLRAAGSLYTMEANIFPSEGNLGARYTVHGRYYFEGDVLMTQGVSYSNARYYNASSSGPLSAARLERLEEILSLNAFGAQTIEFSEDGTTMTLTSDVVTECTIPSVSQLRDRWGITTL